MTDLRFKQIHLDFHTSEHIPDVGSKFDAKVFAETLKDAYVDSVTCFSKCHHGWSYHQTKVGKRHPNLCCELLPLQIEACHSAGIKVPVYFSAGYDELAAREHPEWKIIRHESEPDIVAHIARWQNLCLNTAYLDYLIDQTVEVVKDYDCDGLFYDIILQWDCCCEKCLRDMKDLGYDANDLLQRMKFRRHVIQNYYEKIQKAVHGIKKDLSIFHNSGHVSRGDWDSFKCQSHLELESLPTGGWGYDHFWVSARYAQTLGIEYSGMTGKFHTTWGEFGGFKQSNAILAEIASMLANGAKCSVGDQLDPSGRISSDTYRLIKPAYKMASDSVSYCLSVTSVADIGLLDTRINTKVGHRGDDEAIEGAMRVLMEKQLLFDILDYKADFDKYRLLILPDVMLVDENIAERLNKYIKNGGKILISSFSGTDKSQIKFLINFDAEIIGQSEYNPEYIEANLLGDDNMPADPMVIYDRSLNVAIKTGTVLSNIIQPYFNRSVEMFCSHQHSPASGVSNGPAVVRQGNIIWFAHKIFTCYRKKGQPFIRDLIANAINELLPAKTLEVNMPTSGRTTLMYQEQENRYILHLLYFQPAQRGDNMCVIEDIVPIYDIKCRVKLDKTITDVVLVPAEDRLEFKQEDEHVEFTVPQVNCNQMIALYVK